MPHRSSLPPRAVELDEELRPKYGERKEDYDRLAKVNAKIARYRYIIGFVILVVGTIGIRAGATIIWPEQRFRDLEQGQNEIKQTAAKRAEVVNSQLSRIDSVQITNAVINMGMAKFACLKSTPEQAQLLPWSCKRLFDTGELVTTGAFHK